MAAATGIAAGVTPALAVEVGDLALRCGRKEALRDVALAPTTRYVELTTAILFRGADTALVATPLLALAAIGAVPFAAALPYFRHSLIAGRL